MPTVGKIKIDLTAGTAQFNTEMDRASQKLKEFGAHGVTQVQAVSGTIRTLEGNGIRAAERLLASFKGIGPVLQQAFPLVGAVALAGVVGKVVEEANKAYEAFKKLQEAPQRITQEFQGLAQPIRVANDELAVSNDRLANEIAKLQGKPQNGLKLALDEARLSADKLAESLNRDLEEAQKLLEQEQIGALKGFFTNNASTSDLTDQFKKFREGLVDISLETSDKLSKTSDPKQQAAIYEEATNRRKAAIESETAALKQQLDTAKGLQDARAGMLQGASGNRIAQTAIGINHPDQSARISELKGLIDQLQAIDANIALSQTNARLEGTKAQLEANKGSEDKSDYFGDLMARRQAELSGAKSEAANAGNVLSEALAQGASKAAQDIAELNKELAKNKEALTLAQQAAITATDTQIALAELSKRLAQQKAEEEKKAAEEYIKSRGEMQAAEERLAKVAEEKQKQEIERLNKLRGDLTAIKYEIEAAWGSPEEQFQAKLAGIRAQGRENNTPQDQIDEQVQLATAQHELENKRNLTGDYGSAENGVKAYFDEMVANARTAAQQVHDLLSNAFQSLNDTLARAMTGQKANWASFFRGLSQQLSKMALQNAEVALVKGIHPPNQQQGGVWDEKPPGGILGKLFGGGVGKRDGSSQANALFVTMTPNAGSATGANGISDLLNQSGGSNQAGGDQGGGSAFGNIVGSLLQGAFGGFRAEGGSVDPGAAYMVGEQGPELWVPPSAGTVIPNHKLGGNQTVIHVDARGSTDPVMTAAQTRRAVIAAHNAAVGNSVRAVQERAQRRPQ